MANDKQFKTVDEQILLLKSRKLQFKDEAKAKAILEKINYFDIINGTENILLKTMNPKVYDNVYFEDFYEIYKFDTDIRILTLKKIFEIEARLRTSLAHNFASQFCTQIPDTLNYREKQYYQQPAQTNTYLYNTFMKFDLFKRNVRMPNGTVKLGFVESKKRDKDYIRTYNRPPFWVIIKDFSFGDLYFTYCFQKDVVKDKILKDFGLTLNDDAMFQQILHTLKYARNCCAHLELITRFKLLGAPYLNNYKELKQAINCTHKHLSYYDLLKIIQKFCDTETISKEVNDFHRNMYLINRLEIADKLLKRMGEADINNW
jgi:abortive infection bacteriophage resistance protein